MAEPHNFDEQIEAEQRKRRRRAWALSPEQRLELAWVLTQDSMEQLRRNPAAYLEFLKRQFFQRRLSRAEQREVERRIRKP